MATVEEIEKYCRNCVSRDFVNGKGLVCKRTRELPDFDEECENFEKDEELLKMAPPKPDDFPVSMTEEELLAEENLPKGVLYASVACILGRWHGVLSPFLQVFRWDIWLSESDSWSVSPCGRGRGYVPSSVFWERYWH